MKLTRKKTAKRPAPKAVDTEQIDRVQAYCRHQARNMSALSFICERYAQIDENDLSALEAQNVFDFLSDAISHQAQEVLDRAHELSFATGKSEWWGEKTSDDREGA